MHVLEKTLLDKVAGGVSVLMGEDGGDTYGALGGGGGGGGFDANGIGANSCVAAPAASGLFGYTFTETVAGATALTGLTAGLGQGVGASLAIESAGGMAGVGEMGAAAAGLVGSAALGLGSALVTGFAIGSIAYNNIETVQDGAQAVIGGGTDLIVRGTEAIGVWARGIDPVLQQP